MADARIQEATDERAALLRTLAETQHAKPTLAALKERLAALQQQYLAMSRELSTVHAETERDKAAWDALQHQHVRKWFQDRGARKQQLEQEKGAYLTALRAEEKAAAAMDVVRQQIDALRRERDALRKQVDAGVAAEVALEALYARVFAGPTPASPEEDALEARTQAAQAAHDAVQQRVFVCGAVSNEVHLALACANRAVKAIGVSVAASESDMLVLGTQSHATDLAGYQDPHLSSARFDAMERDALRVVQSNMAEAELHMATAQRLAPDAVGDFFHPAVTNAHTTNAHLDFWLDTPITDYLFHRDLVTTRNNVLICYRALADEAARANARLEAAHKELEPLAAELTALRRELFDLRAAVFARLVDEKGEHKKDG